MATRRSMWWLSLLACGCAWIGEGKLDEVRDRDGDGAYDCAYVSADEACDCDDADPDVGAGEPELWYVDADGDGSGAGDGLLACVAPGGFAARGGDCDDADPLFGPDAVEVCGGLDEDCDGQIDDEDPDVDPGGRGCFVDADGDGYGDDASIDERCTCLEGDVSVGGDCDDGAPEENPGAPWYEDLDGDGFGTVETGLGCLPPTTPGPHVRAPGDCDDGDPTIHPDAVEVWYDGVDQNCNQRSDLAVGQDDAEALPPYPMWLPDPSPGEDFDPTLAPIVAQPCEGEVAREVDGGGDEIQAAFDDGAVYVVAGPGVYDPFEVPRDACVVGVGDVSIVASGSGTAAVTLGADAETVILEGLQLSGDLGVRALDPQARLMLSRVDVSGASEAVAWGSVLGPRQGALRLHHTTIRDGNRVGDTRADVLVRHSVLQGLITADPSNWHITGALNAGGIELADCANGGTAIQVVGASTSVEAATVDGHGLVAHNVVGGVLGVQGTTSASDVVLSDILLRDVVASGHVLSVGGPSAGAALSISLARIDARVATTAGAAALSVGVDAAASVGTVSDVVWLVDGAVALQTIQGPLASLELERVALAAHDTAWVADGAPISSDLTMVASRCVSHKDGAGAVNPAGRVYAVCVGGFVDDGLGLTGGGAKFLPVNAAVDLGRYHPCLSPSAMDLRMHPASFQKIGSWSPGFSGTSIVDADPSFAYGAYVGGDLVTRLHDLDGDGIYDDYGVPGADADGDGLTTEQEWVLRTDPEVADTDGDGLDDGSDPEPIGDDEDLETVDCAD